MYITKILWAFGFTKESCGFGRKILIFSTLKLDKQISSPLTSSVRFFEGLSSTKIHFSTPTIGDFQMLTGTIVVQFSQLEFFTGQLRSAVCVPLFIKIVILSILSFMGSSGTYNKCPFTSNIFGVLLLGVVWRDHFPRFFHEIESISAVFLTITIIDRV